jgi:hypothetical protein
MNTVPDNVKRRLAKMLELARRGEPGEKDNAERMLMNLLHKYNVTLEDLEKPERARYTFNYSGNHEKQIVQQIIYRVTNDASLPTWKRHRNRTELRFDLTPMEFAEAMFLWDLYRRQWHVEVERLRRAFVQRYRLFGEPTGTHNEKPLSESELRQLKAMMRALGDVHEHRPLEHKRDGPASY